MFDQYSSAPSLAAAHSLQASNTVLAHEQGRGAPCTRCGPACPGFDLHYWRKVCRHCRCGSAEHGLFEDTSGGQAKVQQLFGDPASPCLARNSVTPRVAGRPRFGRVAPETPPDLEWVPPGAPPDLVQRYLCQLPPERVPIRGTSGAVHRQRSLQTQLPAQDLDETRWLGYPTHPEAQRMRSYVQDVRQNALGQGIVCEFPVESPNYRSMASQNTWGPLSPPGRAPALWRGPAAPAAASAQPQLQAGDPTFYATVFNGAPQQAVSAGTRGYSTLGVSGPAQPGQLYPGGSSAVSGLMPASPQWPNSADPLQRRLVDLSATSRGVQHSASLPMGAEASGGAGAPWRRSPSPSPRRPFRSSGGLSSASCRSAVTVTGDQPFRGLQDLVSEPAASSWELAVPPLPLDSRPGSEAATVAPADRPPAPAWDSRRRWCCHQCRAAMRPGDVAVFAERAGANKCWHPRCFVCATCQELLVDLIYFFKGGQVFCGRHYAERQQLSRCPGCDELIFSHQYTEAGGRRWHTRHFVCAACCRPLAAMQYVLREDRPHCIPCYQDRYGKTCVTCSRPIAPSSQRVSLADRLFWHADGDCFHCYTCRASLLSTSFVCSGDKVFCSAACAAAF